MSDEPYGLDPTITQNLTISNKRSPGPGGIGLGAPRRFPFKQGQALGDTWTVSQTPNPGWSVTPFDGYLRFEGPAASSSLLLATIARAFSLSASNVTVAFKIRMNRATLAPNRTTTLQLGMVDGPYLYFSGAPQASYGYQDPDTRDTHPLSASMIVADGSWHEIVMCIEPGNVQLWQDNVLMFSYAPEPALVDTVQLAFGVGGNQGDVSVDYSDVSVIVGLNRQARVIAPANQESDFNAQRGYLNGLASNVSDLLAASRAVVAALRNTDVGPGVFFWGLNFSSEVWQAVEDLAQDARVARFRTAAVTGAPQLGSSGATTFYVGVTLNVSFVISGGYSLGFLLCPGVRPMGVLSYNVGATTNAGLQAVVDLAVLWALPEDALGWGSYVQGDGGEFFQGSLGAMGGIPLHLRTWDNCGPVFSAGVGVSVLPLDVAGGLSYMLKTAQH